MSKRWGDETVPVAKRFRSSDDKDKRTNVCFAYQKGSCSRGSGCKYLHEVGKAGADKWGKADEDKKEERGDEMEKEKANFGLSGALNEDENSGKVYKGIVLNWSEPPDAHLPKTKWRLYLFKKDELVDTLYLHRQTAFLFGREKKIADVLVEHPSCSKQHAVLQFKIKLIEREAGSVKGPKKKVRPYILDLESTNGTWLNGEKVPASRYVELLEKDVLKFGESTREYVLLSDKSK